MDSRQNDPAETLPLNMQTVKQLQVEPGPRMSGTSSYPEDTGVELQSLANLSWVISAHALLRIASGTVNSVFHLPLADAH